MRFPMFMAPGVNLGRLLNRFPGVNLTAKPRAVHFEQ